MSPYELTFFHRVYINDGTLISRDTYRFKTRFNRVYFIDVECFEQNLYVAKFYLRIHKNLENKYRLLINDGDGYRILSTCVSLAVLINKRNPKASFGFIGERRLDERDFINTQRYRIYSMLCRRYFSPKKYNHENNDNASVYFVLNKAEKSINKQIIEQKLVEYYEYELL